MPFLDRLRGMSPLYTYRDNMSQAMTEQEQEIDELEEVLNSLNDATKIEL